MLHSSRVLLDLGIPELDDRAFRRDGGQIKAYIGGGGSSGPTSQTVTQTNIPEYARPYAEEMLGSAQALTDINQNPFQSYGDQRFAGFTPMQAQAFQNVAGQQVAPQLADASNLAYSGAQQGLGAQQTAQGLQQTALGYGGAGAGFGGAASQFGIAGAQQAQRASQLAQAQALGYGAQGAQFGASGADMAAQAQRAAESQADLYGQMGAGFGTSAAGLAPEAQMYGAQGAQFGQAGMGFGAQGAGIGARGVGAAEQGFGAGAQYAQQATSPEAMQAYMSPYMQNVVDVQSQEARRQSEIEQQGIQSQAAQQGAFGGSRSAILEAERQRNLGTQLGRIQAEGSQRGFEQAQQAQQFGAGLGLQGLQAGYQGLQAGMAGTAQGMQGAGVGISGAQAGLQGLGQAGQLYGQGMQGAGLGLQGTGQRLAAGQLGLAGTAQGMQGSEVGLRGVGQQLAGGQLGLEGARTGIAGQQAGISGAQAGMQGVGQAVGAGQYGLSGAQLGISGAGALGQLGQEQYAQEMGITDAMQKFGALQQGQSQQEKDFQYQQFLAQQQYPYQQLSYMSDLLRGVPSTQSAQLTYAQQPNQTAQLLGAGLGAYGALGRKEGGQIKKYQEGGQVSPTAMSTMAVQELPSRLKRLSDSQLAAYARTVKDAITLSAVQSEMQRRSKTRAPMGEMPQETVADEVVKRAGEASIGQPRVGMYGGGIVALQGGGGTGPFSGMEEYGFDPYGQPSVPESTGPTFRELLTPESVKQSSYYRTGSRDARELAQQEANAREAQNAAFLGDSVTIDDPFVRGSVDPDTGRAVATPEQWAAGRNDPIPDSGAKPQVPEGSPDWWASTVPQEQVPDTYIEQPPQQPQTGIAGAGAARRGMLGGTFEQFRSMIPKGEMDPQQQNLLNDMQSRLTKKLDRAESQENNAKFDAIMMAGLAMMGGTSLADGIARAAQTGGATYMSSKKDAAKALNAAEDAELAFRQYEMSVMKGNDDAARKDWSSYMGHIAKLQDIDSRYAVAGINAQTRATAAAEQRAFTAAESEKDRAARMEQTNITAGAAANRAALNAPRLALQDEARINDLVKDKFEDRLDAVAIMPAGPEKNTAAAQLEQDMEAYRRQKQASLGGGSPQGAVAPPSARIGNRPDIASTMKPFN